MSSISASSAVVQVRPTLKALKMLPRDDAAVDQAMSTFERAKQVGEPAARRSILAELTLGKMPHPLLDDARTRIAGARMPDIHVASSTQTGRTVYEVRSRTGAAWRGALVLEDGVMWLVFAERHDRFHSTAAGFFKSASWQPTDLDRALAKQDTAVLEIQKWRTSTLLILLDALRVATDERRVVHFQVDSLSHKETCEMRLEIEHEQPASSADHAHTTSGMIEVSLRVDGDDWELVQSILGVLAIIRDGEQEQAFLPGGGLLLLSTISHARLAQLTAAVDETTDVSEHAHVVPAPGALHYANTIQIAAGFVNGSAALSLCGEWFVPSVDDSSDLPVCSTCEELKPVAQALLDHLRARSDS